MLRKRKEEREIQKGEYCKYVKKKEGERRHGMIQYDIKIKIMIMIGYHLLEQ